MKKSIYSCAAVLVLVAGVAWAGGKPWKTKPYEQWDMKDVTEVLDSSPWVKVESVMATWRASATPGDEAAGRGMPQTGMPRPPGGQNQEGQEGAGEMRPTAMARYMIRWTSAVTTRKALARSAVLRGKVSEAAAAKYVAEVPPAYEIVVLGRDMTPFLRATADGLKADSYLEAKQSKQKAGATSVTINHVPGGSAIDTVVFKFPKALPGGQPLLGPKDKDAEFVCRTGGLYLNAKFDLRKMTVGKGPDL